jgi:hypothetical protein
MISMGRSDADLVLSLSRLKDNLGAQFGESLRPFGRDELKQLKTTTTK